LTGFRGAAAVVGVADAASPTGELELTGRALEVAMLKEALDDAGLQLSDIDGICHSGSSMAFAEYLGINCRFTDSTMTGGSVFEVFLEHAASAVTNGMAECVAVVFAQTPRADRKKRSGGGGMPRGMMMGPNPMAEWEMPYGLQAPKGGYALAASRHMAQYGTTSEQLAKIAVHTRDWASLNPRARYRDPITVDDVLASPYVAAPLHKLDCCLVTDGAGALVLTSADRARDLRQPPVFVLGAGTAHTHGMSISQMPDLTTTGAAVSGPQALSMAGVGPSDIDVVELYDSFTITALMTLEDLGFCQKGEGGAFVADGRLGPGGSLPTNTNGGGLAYTHPGMYGMFVLVEAVRQLRGDSGERQVSGAEVAVANGCGGVLSCTSTIVLGGGSTI
jgi:acetyl-CoA acetyltransferase